MKKQRWLSLVLILALVVGLCSVCAAAADDQTAEQPAQEAADTVAEAEAAGHSPMRLRQKQTRKLPNSRSRMRRQKRMRPQRKRRRTARTSTQSTARTPVRNRLSSR